MSGEPSYTLGEEFEAGQELFRKIEKTSLSSTDSQFQNDVLAGIAHLERAADLVEKLNLFSSNEILEDISTSDLRFLLIDSYLGELVNKKISQDREEILKISKKYFEQFLERCDLHAILSEEDKKYRESIASGGPTDAATRRSQKISRFKREKAIQTKIDQLQEQIRMTSSNSTLTSADGADIDELNRDSILSLVDLFVQRSLENLSVIAQEMEMVREMKDRVMSNGGQGTGKTNVQSDETWRVDPKPDNSALLSSNGRPLRPFVITNQREQLRDQVFRPGWNLPTMTVEEYLDRERQRGNILSGGTERPEKPVIDDNDDDAQDAETYKQREWDEFTDNNPRGWGNRMNKG